MSVAPGIQRAFWKPMSEREWATYYGINQVGRGMTYFRGTQHQRGSGIGSLFGGLLRAVMPVAKSALKTVGKQAIRTGLSVATDALAGENPLQSLEHHGKKAAANVINKVNTRVNTRTKRKRKKQIGRGVGNRQGVPAVRGAKRINRTATRKKAAPKTDFLNF